MPGDARRSYSWIFPILLVVTAVAVSISAATVSNGSGRSPVHVRLARQAIARPGSSHVQPASQDTTTSSSQPSTANNPDICRVAGFFPAGTRQALSMHFGMWGCKLHGTTWTITLFGLVGGKLYPSIPVPAAYSSTGETGAGWGSFISPGGSGIAVEHCAQGNTQCLSNTTLHSLSSFQFYWAPDPWIAFAPTFAPANQGLPTPSNFVGYVSGGTGNGFPMFFDTDTNRWYPYAAGASVLAGHAPSVAPLPSPPGIPLSQALATSHPPAPDVPVTTHYPGHPRGWNPPSPNRTTMEERILEQRCHSLPRTCSNAISGRVKKVGG